MEIALVDEVSKEDSDCLFHWRDRVFPIEGKDITWAKSKWHLLAYEKELKPSAHIGYADFSILIDGEKEERVIGVGGVVVRPEYQGKKIPTKLFDYLHNSQHATSISKLFILFCPKRLERYYQSHGYTKFNGVVTFVQNGKVASSNEFTLMYFGRDLPAKTISVNGEPW